MFLSADLEEPHNYEATISYLRNYGNSINLCTSKEIADCKSAKPINIVTLCGMKMCQKWYFPKLTVSLNIHSHAALPSHFFLFSHPPPRSSLLKI